MMIDASLQVSTVACVGLAIFGRRRGTSPIAFIFKVVAGGSSARTLQDGDGQTWVKPQCLYVANADEKVSITQAPVV